MKHGDLVGCSMRGGRWGGAICERGSSERSSPPLMIDEPFWGRIAEVSSSPHSGETCGSRMMSEVHSVVVFEMCKLDGRLFFLDSEDFIRISEGIGVVGGVENVSPSGDGGGNAKVAGMTMVAVEGKERA